MQEFDGEQSQMAQAVPKEEQVDRRGFVQKFAMAAMGAVAAGGAFVQARSTGAPGDSAGEGTVRDLHSMGNIPATKYDDVVLRMQRELERAMVKPVEKRHWVMVIDKRKCIGCQACTIGCIAENKLPPGVVYRPVLEDESGTFPNCRVEFTPRPCMHCDKPSCTSVCPVNATTKRLDGIVAIDYDKCIGCRYCMTACPYGARTFDFGENYSGGAAVGADHTKPDRAVEGGLASYDRQPSYEYNKKWDRKNHASPVGNARKCHFCLHRLESGKLPMCTTTCIGRATFFGDANDPESLVSELITKHNVQKLLPHMGTQPRVFYIV